MPRSYDDALNRIPSQKEKIINLLRERGAEGAYNTELVQICLQYNSRLSELNREGYVIETIHIKDGLYKYVLHKVPGSVVYYANASDEVVNAAFKVSNNGWIKIEHFMAIMDDHFTHMVRKPGYYKQQFQQMDHDQGQQLELF